MQNQPSMWWDVSLAVILTVVAVSLAILGGVLTERNRRRRRAAARTAAREAWRAEWLVGDPALESTVWVGVDPASDRAAVWTRWPPAFRLELVGVTS